MTKQEIDMVIESGGYCLIRGVGIIKPVELTPLGIVIGATWLNNGTVNDYDAWYQNELVREATAQEISELVK